MRNDLLTKAQEDLLDREGRALREMMATDGWKIMSALFKSTVERFDSTHGLKTLKEMLARQDALAMMNAWMEAVVQRVSRLEQREITHREVRRRMATSGIVTVVEGSDEES